MSVQGYIFNVQSYCIHDGPGIRSTVFLKGCPLSCRWCQNPESQSGRPQLLYYRDLCTGCGGCTRVCPEGAVQWKPSGRPRTDRSRCRACGRCTVICPANAREIAGKEATVEQVLEQVLADKLFLEASGGGMTVSGGEPLYQPEFTAALCAAAHDAGLHTAIETCTFAAREAVDTVFAHTDLALCDIKHMDSARHCALTGVPNEQILSNLIYIRKVLKKDMEIRTPLVPGCNGDLENIRATAGFIARYLGEDVPWRLLPYHRLGESKRRSLESEGEGFSAELPEQSWLETCKKAGEEYGLTVLLGG